MTVHDTLNRIGEAWNAGDGAAYGAEFTPDATYVVFDGTVLRGSEEIARTHQWLFDGPLRGSRMSVGDTEVRVVTPGVAVVLSGGAAELGAEPDPDRASVQTFVLVEHGGQWRITSFQNTRRGAAARAWHGGGGPGLGQTQYK